MKTLHTRVVTIQKYTCYYLIHLLNYNYEKRCLNDWRKFHVQQDKIHELKFVCELQQLCCIQGLSFWVLL